MSNTTYSRQRKTFEDRASEMQWHSKILYSEARTHLLNGNIELATLAQHDARAYADYSRASLFTAMKIGH